MVGVLAAKGMPASLIGFYAFWAGNYAVSNFGQHRDGRSKCPKTIQNQKKRSEAEKNTSSPKKQ